MTHQYVVGLTNAQAASAVRIAIKRLKWNAKWCCCPLLLNGATEVLDVPDFEDTYELSAKNLKAAFQVFAATGRGSLPNARGFREWEDAELDPTDPRLIRLTHQYRLQRLNDFLYLLETLDQELDHA